MKTLDHEADHDFSRGMGRGNYAYRDMEAEAPAPTPEQHDLTLGMTALLGIFLAVVLVCAVFFGFGYSTARTLHGVKSPAQAAPAASSDTHSGSGTAASSNDAAADDSGVAAGPPPQAGALPITKPSAGAAMLDSQPAQSPDAASHRISNSASTHEEEPGGLPAIERGALTSAGSTYAGPADAAAAVMVQIAAVVHQSDADMLARALRANGYAAVVRTEPQDKFLHVQVGPFATRDQAKAMRTRLQENGYNAFLKP